MSLDATRWAWQQKGLRPTHKLVLLSMADRANEFHEVYPSHERLIEDTGVDSKTIWRALKQLADDGIISDTGKRVGSTGRVIVWRLNGVSDRHLNDSKNGIIPKTESFQKRRPNDSKNGRLNHSKNGMQNLPVEPTKEPVKKTTQKNPSLATESQPISISRSPNGSRLPDGWTLPDEWAVWAQAEGRLPAGQVYVIAESFRDYWHSVAGQKGRKADWFATWRNWIRRHNENSTSRHHGKSNFDAAEYNRQRIRELG